jgi:hypothetical protein
MTLKRRLTVPTGLLRLEASLEFQGEPLVPPPRFCPHALL